jgi:cathepsin B
MKYVSSSLLLLLLLVAVTYVTCVTMMNDLDLISSINNDPKSSWKARPYKQFQGRTLEELRGYLGTALPYPETIKTPRYTMEATVSIPKEFDARKAWPQCVSVNEIRNQANCGSCWAFSGAEVLGDRFCIATNGTFNEDLSPEYIVGMYTTTTTIFFC